MRITVSVQKTEEALRIRKREYQRLWRERNRAAILEKQRAWAAANKERLARKMREWKAANRDHVYEERKRRSKEIRAALVEKLGGCCVECGSDRRLEFDHIYGTTVQLDRLSGYDRILLYRKEAEQGLLQLLCKKCNQKRGRPELVPEAAEPAGEQLGLFEEKEAPVDLSMVDAPF